MNEFPPPRDFKSLDSKDAVQFAAVNYGPTVRDQSNEFLGHVSLVDKVSVKDVAGIPCVNIDGVGGNFNLEMGLDTLGNMLDSKKNSDLDAVKQSNYTTQEFQPQFKLYFHEDSNSAEPETEDTSGGVSSPQSSHPSGSQANTESGDINSGAVECMNESTPSSPASGIAENASLNGWGLSYCIGNSYMDDTNMEVVLHPDYVIYRDNYYMGSRLTFSQCHVQISDSTACENQATLNIELTLDDLVDITSQLFQSSGMITMTLCVRASNAGQANDVSCSSGVEELRIAVADYNWPLKQKQIMSLNVKYAAVWKNPPDVDVEGDKIFSDGPTNYFPNFQEPFEEVVYPKGDPDAVSLSKRDVDLLQPDTFINDTIIDFYIQYVKNKIQEEEKSRFHFFNSFFFRKLADMDKNPSNACDGRAAFLRVRKWTRKVNLFEKDYIFIPVNFNLHWSLLVICHPGEVVNFNFDELDKSHRVPCILHMDSIRGLHSGLKDLIQSYLCEEWKERKKDTCGEDLSARFLNMRFLPVALPQQENSYDCGLFLLHYLELFLAEAPVDFNPFKLSKFSNFLNLDWFSPAEAYLKRTLIQRLIFELVENHGSHEGFTSDHSDDPHCSESNDNRIGDYCHVTNGESSTSHSGQGIEITILPASSSPGPHSLNTSGMVLKDLFEPGAGAGTSLGHCQSFDQRPSGHCLNGSVYAMGEGTDLSEHLTYMTSYPSFQQVTGISQQSCSLPYLPMVCGNEIPHRLKSSQAEHVKAELPLDTSSNASDDSDDIGIIECWPVRNEARSLQEDERRVNNCTSTENLEHLPDITGSAATSFPDDSLLKNSQHSNAMYVSNNGDQYLSCQDTLGLPLHQVSNAVDGKATDDDAQIIDNMESGICDEQAAKKRQLMPLQGGSDQYLSCQDTPTLQLHQVSDAVDGRVASDDAQVVDKMESGICEEQAAKTRRVTPLQGGSDQYLSCQDTPTLQLHQVSDAVDNKVTGDDAQVIDRMESGICEEQAAKRQLMPLQGGSDQYLSCRDTPTLQLHQVSDAVDDKATGDGAQATDNMESSMCEEQGAKTKRVMPLQGGSDQYLSCQDTPTFQLHQVSDAVDGRVASDDAQVVDKMESGICEEQAAKTRRVTPLQGGTDQYLSCQDTPTLQLHQVSDAVDDRVASDDAQVVDKMESVICEEQAAKTRRVTPLQGGTDQYLSCQDTPTLQLHQVSDAVNDKVTGDGAQVIDNMESSICEEQGAKTKRVMPLQGISDQFLSCQDTPTFQLHQVSDAVDDKVKGDDARVMDNMESGICEEQATKKRRLMPVLGGSDEIQTESNL